MRSTYPIIVRNRTDAGPCAVTTAVAPPIEPKWHIRSRAIFILGSAAALWLAAWTAVHSIF
jgi:hypothetical protein